MKPVFLVSDIHAGIRDDGDEAPRLADFHALLERARSEGSELVVLGDLFDFWFQWREVVPSRHLPWLEALRQTTRGGLPVTLLPGNHDFHLTGLLESHVGLHLPGDGERRDLLGTRALLHHGDGLDPRERGYRLMRRVFRSRWAQAAFRWLHPDLGMRLADHMGGGDRQRTWSGEDLCAYLRRALPEVLREDDGLMVMGHVHAAGRFHWRQTLVVTLPPFMSPARGHATWDGAELAFHYLHPHLAVDAVEESLA